MCLWKGSNNVKQHFKKYGMIYQIILIAICIILSVIFVYLGSKNRSQHRYTKEEATNLMKLQADKFTRMIEIQNSSCINHDLTTLSEKEMDTYGFDSDFYEKVIYTMRCKDDKQVIVISVVGAGDFKGYELTDYISNNNKVD